MPAQQRHRPDEIAPPALSLRPATVSDTAVGVFGGGTQAFQYWLKLFAIIVCTLFVGADSAYGGASTGLMFTRSTTIDVESTVVIQVKEAVIVTADGTVDGNRVNGSVFWAPGNHKIGAGTTLHFYEGSAVPGGVSVGNGSGIVVIGVTTIIAVIVVRNARSARLGYLVGGRTVRVAGRMLPASARDEYVEEWVVWLQDLRADGAPWHRRLVEMASIVLVAAPWLAVALRLPPRPTVDQ